MATLLLELSTGWHPGERAIHSLLNVPTSSRQNPTTAGLAPSYSYRIIASPLLAVGTVDDHGRPWTSLWGGERGFARPVAKDMLGVQSLVDKTHDPVVQALLGRAADGEVLQPDEGRAMSALSIDLESQDRVKLAGKMVVGTVAAKGHGNVGEAQIAMLVQESLGNCPKYLNKKSIRAHLPFPQLASTSLPLGAEALALVEKADLCFLSSSNGQTMDTNHRGGPPGFVRVLSNSPSHHREGGDGDGDGVVLVYPEYSGNRLYQTLGNLHINPRVGIAIPDLDTSDVLYLTGETQLLVGPSAAAVMPHTSLAVKITVHSARLVKDGLPFRGTAGEPSPYNPPVRRLASEAPSPSFSPAFFSSSPVATATLIRRDLLTPTIARLTFRLRPNPSPSPHHSQQETLQQPLLAWQPGQHVTLSLAHELASGWRHMDDADPQSLNDDYVRTFTITSPPPPPPPPPPRGGAATAKERETEMEEKMQPEIQMELTLRRHGHVTGLLFSHPLDGGRHARLEMPVLGFGGRFRIGVDDEDGGCGVGSSSSSSLSSKDKNEKNGKKKKKKKKKAVFVAGGIGITPLLAQAQVPGVLAPASPCGSGQQRQEKEENEQDEIAVLWSLRGEDLPLAVEVLGRIEGLGRATRVFFTGPVHGRGKGAEMVQQVRALGARVDVRRMERADVLGAGDAERGTGYFVCASPGLLRTVLDWVGDEEAVFESFGY